MGVRTGWGWEVVTRALSTASRPRVETRCSIHPAKTVHSPYIGNMQITVSATAESKMAPTRATVVARVQSQGESAARAIELTKQDCTTVTQSVESAQSKDALENWSQAALTTWSNRPWKDDGTQGDPVFYASVLYSITFVDFTELAEWLASVGEIDSVNIERVTWGLSDPEVEEATGTVQAEAVTRAREKAENYAHAAGYDSVSFTDLADTGLLNNGAPSPYGDQPVMARAAMFKESAGLEVRPEDVVISASVHARFLAKKNV